MTELELPSAGIRRSEQAQIEALPASQRIPHLSFAS